MPDILRIDIFYDPLNKTILHITDQLGVGGTEVLLKNTIPELREYEHVIVYLGGGEELMDNFRQFPVYNLGHKGKSTVIRSGGRLKKIIKEHKVDIVHAHLFWSSLIARWARTPETRLISTIHSVMSKDAFEKNANALIMEKATADWQNDVIGVSRYVLDDYIGQVGYQGRTHVLYNLIPDSFHKPAKKSIIKKHREDPVKCVAVGNLKEAKNYFFLLEAFRLLSGNQFQLDIIGEGQLRTEIQEQIDRYNLPVRILGRRNDLESILGDYAVFIQASTYEGFGIAMAEGIAAGLLPVLSDIPVHREVTANNAIYFTLDDPAELARLLLKIDSELMSPSQLEVCRSHVRDITSSERYFTKLREIYAA